MNVAGGRAGGTQRRGDPYAGIPGARLFVAVPLPTEAAAAVSAVVDEVRAAGLPEGMHDVRWVRLDGLHLTLRFLGPTPETRIGPTTEAVQATVRSDGAPTPFDVVLRGAGAFPERGRPRTIWIGVAEGVPVLDALAVRLSETLRSAGWAPETRPFRPHLTLARSDGLAAGPLVAQRLMAAMAERSIAFTADRLVLFESRTGGGPARYVPLATATLDGSPDAPPEGHADVYHQPTPSRTERPKGRTGSS